MTKQRDPLSIDAALARIAGIVPEAWVGMAKEVGKSERHVRRWGDKSAREKINFDQMLALDLLHQKHGGEGFPIHDAYAQLLDVALSDRYVDQFEILRRMSVLAKEHGDAEAALLRYTLPGATEQDRIDAQRELLEAIEVANRIVPLLERKTASALAERHNRGPPDAA